MYLISYVMVIFMYVSCIWSLMQVLLVLSREWGNDPQSLVIIIGDFFPSPTTFVDNAEVLHHGEQGLLDETGVTNTWAYWCGSFIRGFHKWGYTQKVDGCLMETPSSKWMISGVSPILGTSNYDGGPHQMNFSNHDVRKRIEDWNSKINSRTIIIIEDKLSLYLHQCYQNGYDTQVRLWDCDHGLERTGQNWDSESVIPGLYRTYANSMLSLSTCWLSHIKRRWTQWKKHRRNARDVDSFPQEDNEYPFGAQARTHRRYSSGFAQ